MITDYHAIEKKKQRYNRSVSDMVRSLSDRLSEAPDADAFYDIVTDQYLKYGVGMIGLNAAFRVRPLRPGGRETGIPAASHGSDRMESTEQGIFRNAEDVALVPIYNLDRRLLSDLVGYDQQKADRKSVV